MKTLALLAALLLALPAHAALHLPAAPPPGQYVVDLGSVLSADDARDIQTTAERLWTEQEIPLFVVTIDTMARYGGARMNIEDFAAQLFREWGIGVSGAMSPEDSKGVLLLVSKLDRKARIEMGPGWGMEKDATCWNIMQNHLVPSFKKDRYSSGLVLGASALDSMVRGQELPRAPISQERMLAYAGAGVLGLFTLISLLRSGTQGYAWSFWSVVFGLLWGILVAILTPSRRHHHHGWGHSHSHSSWSSSSSSSWSSGGGSSSGRGGGATGSW